MNRMRNFSIQLLADGRLPLSDSTTKRVIYRQDRCDIYLSPRRLNTGPVTAESSKLAQLRFRTYSTRRLGVLFPYRGFLYHLGALRELFCKEAEFAAASSTAPPDQANLPRRFIG